MLSAIKSFLFNRYIKAKYPTVAIELGAIVHRPSFLEGKIVFGKHTRLVHSSLVVGRVTLGDYSYVSSFAELKAGDKRSVAIGKFCSIGRNAFITSVNNHRLEKFSTFPMQEIVFGEASAGDGGDVVIGNDVWIGANAVILPGVTIGDGAVIGAGSVVPQGTAVAAYEIWGGVPAKKIKDRFSVQLTSKLLQTRWWNWSDEELKRNKQLFDSDVATMEAEELSRYL